MPNNLRRNNYQSAQLNKWLDRLDEIIEVLNQDPLKQAVGDALEQLRKALLHQCGLGMVHYNLILVETITFLNSIQRSNYDISKVDAAIAIYKRDVKQTLPIPDTQDLIAFGIILGICLLLGALIGALAGLIIATVVGGSLGLLGMAIIGCIVGGSAAGISTGIFWGSVFGGNYIYRHYSYPSLLNQVDQVATEIKKVCVIPASSR